MKEKAVMAQDVEERERERNQGYLVTLLRYKLIKKPSQSRHVQMPLALPLPYPDIKICGQVTDPFIIGYLMRNQNKIIFSN